MGVWGWVLVGALGYVVVVVLAVALACAASAADDAIERDARRLLSREAARRSR